MGNCKDEMKTTKPKAAKSNKTNKESVAAATTVADCIQTAHEKIQKLIEIKEKELNTESGREAYNSRQLIRLQMMERFLELCSDTAYEYSKDS